MFKRNVPSPISRRSLLGVSALVLATLLIGATGVRAQYPGGGPPGGYPQPAHWEKVVTPSGTNTWSNTYGGSTSSGSSPWPTTWYPNGGFYTYQMGYVSPGYYTQTNSATVSCSGSVHFKFTWVAPNGEKAPKQVITNKSASASWSAPAVNGGGSCSTSLGGPTQSWVNGGSVSDQTYTVMDGSSGIVEFDIALSANAYGSSSMTVPNSSGNVVANVSCDANVTSVRVALGGVVKDGAAWKCLTGDTVTASLDTGGYVQVAGSHLWSATGPVFKDFFVDTPTTQQKGNRRYHEAADKNQPTFTLRYYDLGSSVITCNAQVVTPKGNLAVTGDSETITIVRPNWSWIIRQGAVLINSTQDRVGAFAWGSSPAGQEWESTATVPAPFQAKACDLGYAQLANPTRNRWANKPAPQNLWGFPGNGLWGLDNTFPYESGSGSGTITFISSDSPSSVLPADLDFYKVRCQDYFENWLIFRPSGGEWVALGKYSWNWYAECIRGAGNQWIFNGTATLSHTPPVNTSDHPAWVRKHDNATQVPIGT